MPDKNEAEKIIINLDEPFPSPDRFEASKACVINIRIPFRIWNDKNAIKKRVNELMNYLESRKIRFSLLPLPPCAYDPKEKSIFSPYDNPVFYLDLGFVTLDRSRHKEEAMKTMESCTKCVMFGKECPGIKFISHYENSIHRIRKWLEEIYCNHGKVLDIGCGSYSLLLKFLGRAKMPTLYFLEPDHYNVKTLVERSKSHDGCKILTFIGLGENLPFGDEEMDAVFIKSVYDHLLDLRGSLNEIKRVLKPGGKVFILEEFFADKKDARIDDKQITADVLKDLISKNTHFRNHTLKEAAKEVGKYFRIIEKFENEESFGCSWGIKAVKCRT